MTTGQTSARRSGSATKPGPAAALARGVALVAVRERGGGQEQAAQMLCRAINLSTSMPAQALNLLEAAQASGGLLKIVAQVLARRAPNAIHLIAPFLAGRLRCKSVVVFQGNGFFLIPWLHRRGHRVIAVCDAPQRPRGGLFGLREQALVPLMRRADVVVRTFDFRGPLSDAPIVPNILANFPAAPRPFQRAPIRRLLYVGRLEANKGLPAFLKLAEQLPELEFHVFGAGRFEGAVRKAEARLANLTYHGFSRTWLDSAEGACLLGCAPTEGCWTAGREALLHGIPLLFIPSVGGGPQLYARVTDKAVETPTLARADVLAAIARVERAAAASREPLEALWREHQPDRLAQAFASLCE
ncbi:MAG: hypothetical protein ACHP84_13740 [Caulobacterales bacterium]